jgi:hypothetical protein
MRSLLRRSLVIAAVTLAATLLVAVNAHAQSAVSGSIGGTVTDSTGALLPGATVTFTNTDRGEVVRVVKSDKAGYYTAGSLPLGTYKLTITDNGFKTDVVTGIVLHASDALTINRSLVIGATSETVTIRADQEQLDLQDATSQTLINSTQLTEMPLVTRNYETLMNLQPGVVYGGGTDDLVRGPSGLSGASSVVNFSVNGGRDTSNNWTIDGADNVDRGANLTLYTYPSPDAIAEFKNLRGTYSAQFGRNASGQIDVVTKSGTNDIHGSAYEYVRNNAFDANGYLNDFLGAKIPAYRYNVFGFSFGGPVYLPRIYNGRNKTFFFISEEWQRETSTLAQAAALVPQASERAGDFTQSGQKIGGVWTTGPVSVCTAYTTDPSSQTNTCTATGTQVNNLSPMAQEYLKDVYSKVPVPNVQYDLAHNLDPHTILTNFKDTFNNLDSMIRIDQQVGQKMTVFYRYLHDTLPEFLPQGQFTTVYITGANTTKVVNPGTQHLAHVTYVFSPTLVLNAAYSFSNGNIISTPSGFLASAGSPDIKPSLPYADTVGLIPNLSLNGMTSLNGSVAYTDHGTDHQLYGDITKTLHSHTLIAGMSYNHYQKLENNTLGTQGSFGFGNDSGFSNVPANSNPGANEAQAYANFLIGNANAGFSQTSRDPVTDMKAALWEGFLQDNWKATPRLTLNLGVRYEYYGQPWDANGLLSNFDPSKYSASAAPTINRFGVICFTSPCDQSYSNAGLSTSANASADYSGINYINGMIFNGPSSANNNQASPFGNKVGSAQKGNFAPRFGFALDVFGNGKTALRGGYGWAFDDAEVSYYETTVFDNPPAVSTYSIGQTSFDSPTGGSLTKLSASPGRIQAVPVNYKTPYIQQYSLDVQQQISPTFLFDIGYFGDHGTHLLGGMNINEPRPGSWMGVVSPWNVNSNPTNPTAKGFQCLYPGTGGSTGVPGVPAFISSTCDNVLNQIQPYLGYSDIDAMESIFSSNYNSMQIKAMKRFYDKTYVDVNYTWSRDLTNAPADYSGYIQNIYNINGDYGRAPDDRNNVLTFDGLVQEPWFLNQRGIEGWLLGGWELSGIYSIDSGLPFTVSASSGLPVVYNIPGGATGYFNQQSNGGVMTDNAGLHILGPTSTGLRPNQLGNPNKAWNAHKIHNKAYDSISSPWFYTGAFAAPAPNSPDPGNAKRGTIQGPGFNTLDLGVYRNFRIAERLIFQFRVEAFNAANHTNVNSIGTSATSGSFGLVTGYRDARIMQFAGRFTF